MENEKVFISGHLKEENYSSSVAKELYSALSDYQIIEINNHNNNIWCRDYMPIVNTDNNLVQFKYKPSYMTDTKKWSERIPKSGKIHDELKLSPIDAKDIKLDGGAIEICKNKAIVSDSIFPENEEQNENELLSSIKDKLNLKLLIVLPHYPYDFTGHIDGLVRFVNEDKVIINDLTEEIKQAKQELKKNKNNYRSKLIINWYYSFIMALYNSGLTYDILPTNYMNNQNDKDGNSIYLNFLKLSNRIIMPVYNNEEYDKAAKEKLERIYRKEVIGVDASLLAKEGGMINCVTWTDINYE